jgi:hypothetical protein
MKAKDSGNIAMPTKGSFLDLLSKGNLVATFKAKSNGISSTPTNESFWGSFSKERLVKMKAKGGPLPLPQPLKSMQVSSGTKVCNRIAICEEINYLKQGQGQQTNSKNTSSGGDWDFE